MCVYICVCIYVYLCECGYVRMRVYLYVWMCMCLSCVLFLSPNTSKRTYKYNMHCIHNQDGLGKNGHVHDQVSAHTRATPDPRRGTICHHTCFAPLSLPVVLSAYLPVHLCPSLWTSSPLAFFTTSRTQMTLFFSMHPPSLSMVFSSHRPFFSPSLPPSLRSIWMGARQMYCACKNWIWSPTISKASCTLLAPNGRLSALTTALLLSLVSLSHSISFRVYFFSRLSHTHLKACYCNIMQHTAMPCNTLQHTAMHWGHTLLLFETLTHTSEGMLRWVGEDS